MRNVNLSVLFLGVMPTWGWIVIIATAVVALIGGIVAGVIISKKQTEKKVGSANEQVKKIVESISFTAPIAAPTEAEAERSFQMPSALDVLISLVITIAVYSLPIIIYRYLVIKAPVEEQKAKKKDKPSLMSRVKSWLRTYKSDMKKIVWSSPKQVLHNSILVLVSVVVIGAVIGILDLVFNMSIVGLDSIFG